MKKNHFKIISLSFLILFAVFFFSRSSLATTINKSSSNNTLQNGLVGWWTFDGADTTAVTTTDKSGQGNNGTRNGSTLRTAGRIGQALSFNGTNSYIEATGYQHNTTSVTAWIKIRGTISNFKGIVEYSNSASVRYGISLNTTGAPFMMADGFYQTVASGGALSVGVWHFLAGTYNGVTRRLFVDGVEVALGANVVGGPNLASKTEIGTFAYNDFTSYLFNGQIDDVRIYNRALSPAEIVQLYTQGGGKINKTDTTKPTLKTGLVGHWTFDAKDVTANTTTDRSGQGNNGTRTAVTPSAGKIGQGMRFSNTPSVSVINVPAISGLTATQTRSAWIYITNPSPAQNTYIFDEGTNNNFLGIFVATKKLFGGSGLTNYATGNTILKPFVWYHVAITTIQGNVTIYLNGVVDGTSTGNNSLTPTAISIGSCCGAVGIFAFPGILDDVRVYNRALSPAEVVELYTQGGGKINKTDLIRAQLRNGLVGHWTFDGADVTVVTTTDRSGLGNDGTRNGTIIRTAGKIGQGIKFDGSTGYINATNTASLALTQNYTVSAWVKLNAAQTTKGIMARVTNGDSGFQLAMCTDGRFAFPRYNCTDAVSNDVPMVNKWYHIVGVQVGTNVNKLYVNGVLQSAQGVRVTADANLPLVIGRLYSSTDNFYFNGSIDDTRVYNRALSQAEVTELYRMGR